MPLDVLGCTRATLKCATSNGYAAVRVAVPQNTVRVARSSHPDVKTSGNHCNTLRDRDRAL